MHKSDLIYPKIVFYLLLYIEVIWGDRTKILNKKLQFFCCWKSILRYEGDAKQNIRGLRVLEPS